MAHFVFMAQNAHRRSAWLGLAELRPTSRGTLKLHLRWGRIAGTLGALLAFGYLCAALGVFWLYKERKGYSEVAFTDVLLWQRTKIRQEQGAADIARGVQAIEDGRYREAFNYLRSGLGRAPDNLEGRLLLIRMYSSSHPHLAAELYESGLPFHADNREYLESYARFLVLTRDDPRLLALVRETNADLNSDSEIARSLAVFGMHVSNRNGEFMQAARFFHEHELGETAEGVLEATYALEQINRPAEAVELLRAAISQSQPSGGLTLYRRLIDLLIAEDRSAEAVAAALDLTMNAPLAWQPRLLLLETYEADGREADIEREGAALLRQFRTDVQLVTGIASFAQRTGRLGLAQSAYEVALESGFDLGRFGLLHVEAYLESGDYSQVLELCQEIETANPAWLDKYLTQLNAIRSIAAYSMKDPARGELYLRRFLENAANSPRALYPVGLSFRRAGLLKEAYSVVEKAYLQSPDDERTLGTLIELQIALGDRRELVPRVRELLSLRRPGYEVFELAQEAIATDPAIDADAQRAVLSELETVLQEVRIAPLDFSVARFGKAS